MSSVHTQFGFAPIEGYQDAPDVFVPPGSMVSGANVWVRENALQPRWRFDHVGRGSPTYERPAVTPIVGAFQYHDLDGSTNLVAASTATVSYHNDDNSWTRLTYNSGTSNNPPTGGEDDTVFGASVYLERSDLNWAVFTNGTDPLFVWPGPGSTGSDTGFSTLTQAPIAKDVAIFADRVVAWNIQELSSNTRYTTKVQWCEAGDPEDWAATTIGAGSEDLMEMKGAGTRIFATADELLLASDKELWRGREVGLPYVFNFDPVVKEMGIPYPRAALQTVHGIYWLGSDYQVWRYAGGSIEAVSDAISETLRSELKAPRRAFFSYSEPLRQLTLFYSVSETSYPTKAFTLDTSSNRWTPQTYSHELTAASQVALGASSSATTWGGLIGTIDQQTLTYRQLLGASAPGRTDEAIFSSKGSAYYMSSTASLDDAAAVVAEFNSGAIFAGSVDRVKYCDELRLDLRANSASSLSVAWSGNLGGSMTAVRELALSVQSNTTQARVHPGVSGTYHQLRLRSDETGWLVTRVAVRARDVGTAL